MYVQASRNVIHGDDVNAWRKQITDFYKQMLNDMPSVDIRTAEGDVLMITKAETAHKARDNFETINGQPQKMTNEKFKVKLKAESHIDEITEVSKSGKKHRLLMQNSIVLRKTALPTELPISKM